MEKLSISSYGGTVFPSWIMDLSFNKMVKLELDNCKNIKPVLSLGELLALVQLRIKGIHGVK